MPIQEKPRIIVMPTLDQSSHGFSLPPTDDLFMDTQETIVQYTANKGKQNCETEDNTHGTNT